MIATDLSKLYTPYISEYREAFESFVRSGVYINGKAVSSFESAIAEYLGAKHAAGCGNGTHALQLGLMACGIGPGDEVITVANTYYATARAIIDVGAIPVFCDVNESGLIDVAKIEGLVSQRTRAIMPVHLYGMVADIPALRKICRRHELHLIEDCSHAFGSSYCGKKVGSDSFCACFSLYPTKNLGAMGDAGVVVGNAGIVRKIQNIRYYSSSSEHNRFHPWSLHSRLDSLQARILEVSLSHIDAWNTKRIEHANYYMNRLAGYVPFFTAFSQEGVVPYVFPILVKKRRDFVTYMRKSGIAVQIHYGVNLHKISHLTKQVFNLPMTEMLNHQVVSLPVSPMLTVEDLRYIADTVLRYFQKGTFI